MRNGAFDWSHPSVDEGLGTAASNWALEQCQIQMQDQGHHFVTGFVNYADKTNPGVASGPYSVHILSF